MVTLTGNTLSFSEIKRVLYLNEKVKASDQSIEKVKESRKRVEKIVENELFTGLRLVSVNLVMFLSIKTTSLNFSLI